MSMKLGHSHWGKNVGWENRVLRRVFGRKRDDVTGEWKKLHYDKFNDVYSSPHLIRAIKLRRMWWVGQEARMGRGEVYTGFRWGNLRRWDYLNDPRLDGRIILRWIFRKWDGGAWTALIWLRIRTGEGTLKSGNECSGSIKCGQFLDWLRTGQLLKMDSAPRNK